MTLEQIYQMTQTGRNPVAERLTRIEAKIDTMLRADTDLERLPEQTLDERVDAIIP